MPKDTFLHLKAEKRESIKNAAIEEFAQYGYFNANISRITKRCGISTGSFYQYFEDISDLFIHILSDIAELKIQYIKVEVEKANAQNFEQTLKAIYLGGILFALNEPSCLKIADCFSSLLNTPAVEKLMKYYIENDGNDWLKPAVEQAIQNGEIRNDITMELFTKLFSHINMAIIEHMGLFIDKKNCTEEKMHAYSDLAVSILLNGIKSEKEIPL